MKQTLDEESIHGLLNYRIQRSKETLREARLMIDEGYLNGAINRLYYACYYIVSALLIRTVFQHKHMVGQNKCWDYISL